MKQKRDQRTILIVSLLVIVFIMVVGFATFATNLTINGTANISTNWCVGFDNTKTTAYEITKGKSTGTNPSATMEYEGTACSSTYVPIANLGAVFYQPGDKVEYTLTIANKGSVDAAIESIKVNGSSITSNQTITDGNIIWKVYMPESTTLSATTGTTTMKVSAEFQNTTDISNLTTGGSSSLTVGINVVQGTSGMDITPATFTGTIYRNNTNLLLNGLTMNGDAIVWYPTTKGYSSAQDAFDDYYAYSSQASCEADAGSGNCISGTATITSGSYETQASNLNKTYYLKHTVVNDIITASYVCFVTDTEHCMQGGDSSYYNANKTLLQGQETWFNNHSGSCSFGDSSSSCHGGGFRYVFADSYGNVYAGVSGSDSCEVSSDGYSHCNVSESGGGSGSGGGDA